MLNMQFVINQKKLKEEGNVQNITKEIMLQRKKN